MKKYFITKNDIKKKLDFLLKQSNLSLMLFKELSIRKIYKLLKMLSSFDPNFNFKRKELKQMANSLLDYVNEEIISEELEELIELKVEYKYINKITSLFEMIVSNFHFYFFDKKQVIRC